MAKATIYLKEWTRSGSVLWETPICADCAKVHVRDVPLRRGDERVMRLWSGPETDCGMCTFDEDVADDQNGTVAR